MKITAVIQGLPILDSNETHVSCSVVYYNSIHGYNGTNVTPSTFGPLAIVAVSVPLIEAAIQSAVAAEANNAWSTSFLLTDVLVF